MENFNLGTLGGEKINQTKKIENKIELTGPSLRIVNSTKKKLSLLFGFGLRTIEDDINLMSEINRHFLENSRVLENKTLEWKNALSDVNKDAETVEDILAKNFANKIFSFITTESKIRDKYNN